MPPYSGSAAIPENGRRTAILNSTASIDQTVPLGLSELQARCHFSQEREEKRDLIVETDTYFGRRLTGHDFTSARYEKLTRKERWPCISVPVSRR